jgi:hypothetical protein
MKSLVSGIVEDIEQTNRKITVEKSNREQTDIQISNVISG